MTEPVPEGTPAASEAVPMHTGASAGQLLRQAREAAGLHIGALSVALKVPVKKLEALESDQLDLLPDAVFARALASSMCRTLKIDPAPVLERLPEQVMPHLELDSRTTDRTNLHPPRAIWNAPLLARIPKPVLGVAAALVLAAVVLFFMPDLASQSSGLVSSGGMPATGESVGSGAGAAPAMTGISEVVPSNSAAAVPAVPLAATAAGPSTLVASAPATSTSTSTAPGVAAAATTMAASAPVARAAAGQPATAVSGTSALALRARAPSWIQVTDAAGTVHLRKVLNAGESAEVSGALPLSVVVGRVDAIDVQVRGQAFDLVPLAKDNVARFQVK